MIDHPSGETPPRAASPEQPMAATMPAPTEQPPGAAMSEATAATAGHPETPGQAIDAAPVDMLEPAAPARGTGPVAPAQERFLDVVSGRFDEEEEATAPVVAKRVLAPVAEAPTLHKVLAQAGMGSRLEMEQLIMEGRITVNNEPAHIGQRIQFGDHVKVNGKPIRFRIDPPPARVIAYHKPVGEVVTHDDPQNRPTVFRRLPKLQQGKWQSVGRLDLNTEGLLLFTSSGELANSLMHPRFGLEREYAVRVLGALSNEEKSRLIEGVRLDDGVAQFGAIEDGGGEGANHWYRVTISEGRNREVRRMLEAVGHAVSRLIRIRYGAMLLPRGLKRGAWMELESSDIDALRAASGGRAASGATGGRPPVGARRDADGRGDGQATGAGRKRKRGGRAGERRPADGARAVAPAGIPSPLTVARPVGGGQGRSRQRFDGDDAGALSDRQAADSQPDPMKTAFGYIGADSFTRQRQGQRGGQRAGGSAPGGGRGNGGAPGGGRRGGRGR